MLLGAEVFSTHRVARRSFTLGALAGIRADELTLMAAGESAGARDATAELLVGNASKR